MNKLAEHIAAALKTAGEDSGYIVAVTPPGITLELDWVEGFVKKLEDTEAFMKDAEFMAALKKAIEQSRQKRWSTQNQQQQTGPF